ncbi:hypothetical protein IKE67_07960 [bacterium]|nr:hypothetical protein [bacterium]
MKKLFLLFMLFVAVLPVCADDVLLEGSVSFDWATKTQFERDENISQIRNIIYKDNIITKYNKNELKVQYKAFLKDKDRDKHYIEISNGKKENDTERLAGFYKFNGKLMYMYGVQYKNDIYTTYYYDLMGNLRYIDKMSENYPNYPYYSHQYRITGELAGSIYFTSYDTQYVFKNEKFKGVWFKDTMFDSKAKKIMTRTNY